MSTTTIMLLLTSMLNMLSMKHSFGLTRWIYIPEGFQIVRVGLFLNGLRFIEVS